MYQSANPNDNFLGYPRDVFHDFGYLILPPLRTPQTNHERTFKIHTIRLTTQIPGFGDF